MKKILLLIALPVCLKAQSDKILITLQNAPNNMNAVQLFDNKAHLKSWISQNDSILKRNNIIIDPDKIKINKGTIEYKPSSFKVK